VELDNRRLWNRYMNPIDYAQAFSRMAKDDVELFKLLFQAMEEFGVKAMSLDTIGVFNLGANFTTAMAMRPLLRPKGRMDQLEHTGPDIGYMAALIGQKFYHGRDVNGNQRDFYTLEPFEKYDSLFSQIGGSHCRDTLERTRLRTRVIAGNMLAPADYRYDALASFWVGEGLSKEKTICIRGWQNMLGYVEHGGFFAVAVLMETKEFVTPSGIRIPMGDFMIEELQEAFDRIPVDYKIYVTSGANDIRLGYNKVVLIAGRTK